MSFDIGHCTGGEALVDVIGNFDIVAARRLRDIIGDGTAGPAIIVDFSRAREVTPFALAVLVEAAGDSGSRLRIRGLSLHNERLVHHLTPRSRNDAIGAR